MLIKGQKPKSQQHPKPPVTPKPQPNKPQPQPVKKNS
jgi:hypothetical protein